MLQLAATLHLLGLRLVDQAHTALTSPAESERGSETIEKVLWAAAVIVIVGIAVGVIKAYVTSSAGKIK